MMTDINIADLDHRDPQVAVEIHRIMMTAYGVEADLLGVSNFPPLRRSKRDIADAESSMVGAFHGERLVAVLETEIGQANAIDVAALVVLPSYFRMGLATALLRRLIENQSERRITVSTATANTPAIVLYEGLGFRACKYWSVDGDLSMVTLVREQTG